MFVAICADKGSPGATTTAVVLAASLPRPAIAVEADPMGGDLAIRLRPRGAALPETPTVLSVVTSARADRDRGLVASHAQALNASTHVVPGAVLAEQMANVADWSPLADALARCSTPVFADVGHLHPLSPMLSVAARADIVVVVGRPDLASIIRMRERLPRLAPDLARLRGGSPRFFPVLVTTPRHAAADVGDLTRILAETAVRPFVIDCASLAHDPAAVRRIEAGQEPTGRLARTELLRTARSLSTRLEELVAPRAAPMPSEVSGAGR